eukprot:CAMPEP_0175052854 /NCGR_PEP_ID=MMETSP0052_2-20121109/8592_1 /TAXON_ID=51329 ORGANISM="Polytomella parva, Strain SAG 63-3" /NCGR_SAMPLE_ID=MMETSP0052_2 /ASSEMBLY_ACC=CAM_ASM_000194 /LENGTH=974 /DNA_ID=CAMNT_0016317307 /DNA_START=38 /DNA_END=2962 /DNA_ORIENTATION=-
MSLPEGAEEVKTKMQEESDNNEMLLWSASRGLRADLRTLIARGAQPDIEDKHRRRPHHYAASHGYVKILEVLSSQGVDMDTEDETGRTALHYAAARGHIDAVKFLLSDKGKAWVDASDKDDDTPLHLAARGGFLEVAKALLESGAKPHLVNKRGLTPLVEALINGHVSIADSMARKFGDAKLTDEGKPSNKTSTSQFATLIFDTARRQRFRGFSALHLTAGFDQSAASKWLLDRGSDPNDRSNFQGFSPLHAAAAAAAKDTASVLIKAGSDPSLRSKEGELPYDVLPSAGARPVVSPDDAPPPDPMAVAKAEGRLRRSTIKPMPSVSVLTHETLSKMLAVKGATSTSSAAGASTATSPTLTKAQIELKRKKQEEKKRLREERLALQDPTENSVVYSRYFSKLSKEDQRRKLRHFMKLPPRARDELKHLNMFSKEAVAEAWKAQYGLNCFTAIAALRQDEEMQAPLRDDDVRRAISRQQRILLQELPGEEGEEKDAAYLDKLAQSGEVQMVVAKLRRLYTVLSEGVSPQDVPKADLSMLRDDVEGQDSFSTQERLRELRNAVERTERAAIEEILRESTYFSDSESESDSEDDEVEVPLKRREEGKSSEVAKKESVAESDRQRVKAERKNIKDVEKEGGEAKKNEEQDKNGEERKKEREKEREKVEGKKEGGEEEEKPSEKDKEMDKEKDKEVNNRKENKTVSTVASITSSSTDTDAVVSGAKKNDVEEIIINRSSKSAKISSALSSKPSSGAVGLKKDFFKATSAASTSSMPKVILSKVKSDPRSSSTAVSPDIPILTKPDPKDKDTQGKRNEKGSDNPDGDVEDIPRPDLAAKLRNRMQNKALWGDKDNSSNSVLSNNNDIKGKSGTESSATTTPPTPSPQSQIDPNSFYFKFLKWHDSLTPENQRALRYFFQGIVSLLFTFFLTWMVGLTPWQVAKEAMRQTKRAIAAGNSNVGVDEEDLANLDDDVGEGEEY